MTLRMFRNSIKALLLVHILPSLGDEVHCSRFHYDEQLLEKMIRMEIRMEEMQKHMEQLERRLEVTEQPVAETGKKAVAFFATLHQKLKAYGADQSLVFENVVTNQGDAYDSESGTFKAPTNGTYVFFSTVLGNNNVELWNYIAVNDHAVAQFNSHGTEGRHDSGTVTVVVQLNNGDVVSVKNKHTGGNTYGESYTQFGGFRFMN